MGGDDHRWRGIECAACNGVEPTDGAIRVKSLGEILKRIAWPAVHAAIEQQRQRHLVADAISTSSREEREKHAKAPQCM